MRIKSDFNNELVKNIKKILEQLESLCEYFDMDVDCKIAVSGDSGMVDAYTEKSLVGFEADMDDGILTMTLYTEDDTIKWKIESREGCLDEFKKDYLDLKIELKKCRSKGHL